MRLYATGHVADLRKSSSGIFRSEFKLKLTKFVKKFTLVSIYFIMYVGKSYLFFIPEGLCLFLNL